VRTRTVHIKLQALVSRHRVTSILQQRLLKNHGFETRFIRVYSWCVALPFPLELL